MSYFAFNGISSADLGIEVSAVPNYYAAQRVVESYSVPGRNGSLFFDTGAYRNTTVSYQIWFKGNTNTVASARAIAKWLLEPNGYQTLTDSYEPDVFRKAMYQGPLDITNWLMKYGRATVTFSVQPARYLTSGETAVSVTSGTSLENAYMPSKPLIRVRGTGNSTITVGASTVTITGMSGGIDIDCETMDATYNGVNCNSLIAVSGGFPVLGADTEITFTGDVTVEIVPRWWTL